MSKHHRTHHYVFGLVLTAALAAANPLPAFAQESHQFSVETADASQAIQQFGTQSGLQIMASAEQLQGKQLHPVSGELSTDAGLKALLEGTGLTHRYVGERTVALVKEGQGTTQAAPAEKSKSFWDRFRAAQMDQGKTTIGNSPDPSDASPASNDDGRLEEIIVTAQKKEERLQDVPVPVTAISGDKLVKQNQVRIQEYYTQIPGLNVVPSIQSYLNLSIRGITTGVANPTVGITIDDVPYGASTNLGGGLISPDLDPADLARVEVLRGPQGTLYGASSLGGLLKFVTLDPSTNRMSGRVEAGTSSVVNGDELGYNLRGSVNVPLSDTFAIRASAFTRRDPGYIDDSSRDLKALNTADFHGGRLSALWNPSDVFSLKLGALYQQSSADGAAEDDVALGDLQQSRLIGTGGFERKVQAYSATLVAKMGWAELTSLTGYNVNGSDYAFDFSYAYGGFVEGEYGPGITGAPLTTDISSKKFTQEIRLAVPLTERLDWLVGGFYTDEDSLLDTRVFGEDPASGAIIGTFVRLYEPNTFEEIAAFTNLTYRISDRFDVQVGARSSSIKQSYQLTFTNAAGAAFPGEKFNTEGDAVTYLITPRFNVSPDLMVYARLASGYRAGGPNPVPGGIVPLQYDPDKTQNYELGAKADFLAHTLSVDASLYYIDWKDIQFNSQTPSSTVYTSNGGRAKSQGVELSVEARPAHGLAIAGWVAWNDAVLTEDFPPGATAQGAAGDRLPNSARFTANLSLDKDFTLTGALTGYFGGSVSYVGDRISTFRPVTVGPPLPRQDYAAYTRADLRAGVRHDDWSANIFVTNVTDKRGVLYGGVDALPPGAFTYIQPRTVGVTLERTF